MRLFNFAIIKLTCYLISGILLGYYFDIHLKIFLVLAFGLILLIGGLQLLTKSKLGYFLWIDALIGVSMLITGIVTEEVHNELNFEKHYTNFIQNQNADTLSIHFRIHQILKPSNFHNKYIVKLLKVEENEVCGTLLLNVEKDSLKPIFNVDDVLLAQTNIKQLATPLNPYQFNYKKYLEKKHIYYQLNIGSTSFLKIDSTKRTLSGYAAFVREKTLEKLRSYAFEPEALAIMHALLLGQRQDISKEMYNSYAQAGAIHILAVSGLHIGIILWLLNYLLKFFELFKNGNVYKIILIVFLLWCYALLAGLSPSVTRAVTMFSVFAIAMNLKRPTNVYNTLFISAFLILLIQPNFLFDVGFQLSYLAVLAIVSIEPLLNKLWYPKLKIGKFFWRIFTVTLAAQFGILPLSLYYFHQFPGLFFLSNLAIIPCLSFILGAGFGIIILAFLNILPTIIAKSYGFIIGLMNTLVEWIAKQEAFLFQNISFGIEDVIFNYAIIISCFIALKQKGYRPIAVLLTIVIVFQMFLIYDKTKQFNAFVVFHKNRYTVLALKSFNHIQIHHNLPTDAILEEHLISNYYVGEDIKTIDTSSLRKVYAFDAKTFLIIDSLAIYNVKQFQPDIVLLRNSPKLNLARMIDSLKPQLIISDGSNFRSYQERWEATCKAKEIPFHQTNKKGAFVYKYD